jgi:hypothetical protein
MIFILVTQRPLMALFRGTGLGGSFAAGLRDLLDGLVAGARNMIGIGIATATAGIIVGAVSQTGVGSALADVVEVLSGGNIMAILFLTAILSLILGMGLPTTANYIVVSALLAPVIVTLGQQNGLIVPLIAVHLFVFYFGIMADVTPPVGLASFAAAAVSGGDPIKTGFTAFWYSMRTAALPFLFIFNTQLLLIGLTGWVDLVLTVVMATIAMLVFAAGTMGWFFTKSRIWESALLILIAFTLFRPGFWWDEIYPPLIEADPAQIEQAAEAVPAGGNLRISAEGMSIEGDEVAKTVMLPMGAPAPGAERLTNAGLELRNEEGRVFIDMIGFGSAAEKAGLDFDFEITSVLQQNDRPPRELMWIPALILLAGVIWLQRRRNAAISPAAAHATAGED